MDQFREMQTLIAVADSKSFTGAARQLGVSRTSVTKIIAGLEARLGIRLLIRSTHNVSLTSAGRLFSDEARAIVARVERLHQAIGEEQADMAGDIRLGAPPSFAGLHLLRAIRDFRQTHPRVTFDMPVDDGSFDLAREGLDFTIRIAPILPDSALVARLLVRVPQVVVASPGYLERNAAPRRPEDLSRHNCLVHTIKSPNRIWTFDDDRTVAVTGSVASTFGEVLRCAALAGEGISIHPTYMVVDDLKSGALVRVLDGHRVDEMSIYAIYAERQFRPRRVLAFLDFLRDWLHAQSTWFAD